MSHEVLGPHARKALSKLMKADSTQLGMMDTVLDHPAVSRVCTLVSALKKDPKDATANAALQDQFAVTVAVMHGIHAYIKAQLPGMKIPTLADATAEAIKKINA